MRKINRILILSALFLTYANFCPTIVKAENNVQDTINNTTNSETITLIENCDILEIPESKNLTIDLNGYTLSKLTNRGSLTLIDSQKSGGINLISNVAETALAVANYGSLTIDGANINVTTNAKNSFPVGVHNYPGSSMHLKSGKIISTSNEIAYSFGIANEGTISIDDGLIASYVKNTASGGNNSIGIHNYSSGVISYIKGGTIYAETNSNDGYATAIRNQGTSSITSIEGGIISSYCDNSSGQSKAYGIYNQSGTINTIKGGTIKGKSEAAQWAFGIWNVSKINSIEGGNIIAEINHSKNSPNAIAIANDKLIESISGGVLYAKSTCPNGGTFALRTRNNGSEISSITGGAYYINKIQDTHYIYSENGGINNINSDFSLSQNSPLTNYRYLLPTGASYEENYNESQNLIICDIFDNNQNLIASYKLTGTEKNMAQIGEQTYSTIEEALLAATNGDTVKIIHDNDEAITINKDITLDLNGYVLSNTITNNSNLKIIDSTSNGKIFIESSSNGLYAGIKNYGTLIVDGISIRVNGLGSETQCHGIYNYASGNLTFKNGLIRCVSKDIKFGHGIVNEGTIDVIENGRIESYSLSKNTASNIVGISNLGTINLIKGGTIYSQSYGKNGFAIGIRNQSKATINQISGGLIKGYACSSEGGTDCKGFGIYNQSGSILLIDGGHIEGRSTAAQWAFGIWNPANSLIDEIKGGEIYAYGEHNYQGSSPNFIALSNEGNVNTISSGLFYASSLHEKGSTFGIRNKGTIASISGGIYYVSKQGNELIRNENGTLNISENCSFIKLNTNYNYLISSEEIVCEILDENNNYLTSRIYVNNTLTYVHGYLTRNGYCLSGFSVNTYDSEITLSLEDLSSLSSSATLYAHYQNAPTFYFLGSSVTFGFATGGVSFVNEVQNSLNCKCYKEAVSGTTLTDNGPSSYVERMENNIPKEGNVDHLIVQLSTNDISQNKQIGNISSSNDISTFNKQTVLGAIEYIIAYAKNTWDCEVTFYTNPKYNNSNYESLISKLYDIQSKWNIGIIDFYNYIDMDPISDEVLSTYMADAIHPNAKGYAWMGKIMSAYLKNNYISNHPGIEI